MEQSLLKLYNSARKSVVMMHDIKNMHLKATKCSTELLEVPILWIRIFNFGAEGHIIELCTQSYY